METPTSLPGEASQREQGQIPREAGSSSPGGRQKGEELVNRGHIKGTRKKQQLDMREAEVQTLQTSLCPISFLECAGSFSIFQPHGDFRRIDKLMMFRSFPPKEKNK